MTGIWKEQDGVITFFKAQEEAAFPIEELAGRIKIYGNQAMKTGGRTFKRSLYAEKDMMIHVIECPLLRWNVPLAYDKHEDKFAINRNFARQNVFLQDIVLVAKIPTNGDRCTIGICNTDGDIPLFTNIYDYAEICIDLNFDILTQPQAIISSIENTPGNSDLSEGTGTFQLTDKKSMMLVDNCPTQGRAPAHLLKYTKEYVR